MKIKENGRVFLFVMFLSFMAVLEPAFLFAEWTVPGSQGTTPSFAMSAPSVSAPRAMSFPMANNRMGMPPALAYGFGIPGASMRFASPGFPPARRGKIVRRLLEFRSRLREAKSPGESRRIISAVFGEGPFNSKLRWAVQAVSSGGRSAGNNRANSRNGYVFSRFRPEKIDKSRAGVIRLSGRLNRSIRVEFYLYTNVASAIYGEFRVQGYFRGSPTGVPRPMMKREMRELLAALDAHAKPDDLHKSRLYTVFVQRLDEVVKLLGD
ncbi:MAG: hypothetical protein HY399_08935 [Elusimicrobia bacterium]|nr:hypothetical protein [Elusimicrobiota bacterium]